MKKLLSFVITLVLILNLLSAAVFAEDATEITAPDIEPLATDVTQNESTPPTVTDPLYAYEPPLCIELEKKHYQSNELIALTVTLASAYEYTDHSYAATGFTVLNVLPSGNAAFEVTLQYDGTTPEPIFDFTVQTADSGSFTETVFCVNTDSGLFLSTYSIDSAVDDSYYYLVETGEISFEEYQALIDAYYAEPESETTPQLTAPTLEQIGGEYDTQALTNQFYVQGTFTWKDDSGVTHPLQYNRVDIYANNAFLTTLYTSVNGTINYSFNYNALRVSVYAIVYAGGEAAEVKPGENKDVYSYTLAAKMLSHMTDNVADYTATYTWCATSTETYNGDANNDAYGWHAMQISQAVNVAAQYVKAMHGNPITKVNVLYPADGDTCRYSKTTHTINIINQAGTGSHPNSYAAWDVIMHEYGHHVEQIFEIGNNPGGYHDINEPAVDYYQDDPDQKSKGLRISWAEAYATVFAEMCQQYFISTLQNIYTVADKVTEGYDGVGFNLETTCLVGFYSETRKGESCEGSIIGLLYDLFDGGSNETHDSMSMSHQAFWNLITGSEATTLFEFYTYYVANNTQANVFKLGKLLSYYRMTASNISVTMDGAYTTVSWQVNENSEFLEISSFDILIYSESNQVLYTQTISVIDSDTESFIIPPSDWQDVVNTYGDTCKVAIRSNQNSSPATSYLSEYVVVTKPINNVSTYLFVLDFATSRYDESIEYLSPRSYCDFYITVGVSGYYVVQTFGDKDTVMELYSQTGELLIGEEETDDEGYEYNAYFRYYLTAGAQYKVRARFYDDDEAGYIKLAAFSANDYSFNGTASISCFDNIKVISACTTYDIASELNYSKVLVFEPTATDSYTFELESDGDTFLYVIDPRSNEVLFEYVDYNDNTIYDEFGSGSTLTKHLEAGISYLIICTNYDITDENSMEPMTLTITRN